MDGRHPFLMMTSLRRTAGRPSVARLLLVVLALAGALASTIPGSARDAEARCPVFTSVPDLGRACRAPDGSWRVDVGGIVYRSHGVDDARITFSDPELIHYDRALAPVCVRDPSTEFHNRVLYVRPADRPDRYTKVLPWIRRAVNLANGMLDREAGRAGRDLRYRMTCVRGKVQVSSVALDVPQSQLDHGALVRELRSMGYASPLAKYWIWYDGVSVYPGSAGVALDVGATDQASPANIADWGPAYAMTWARDPRWPNKDLADEFYASVMMHENGHTLGAVQPSAPNSNQGAHCIDDMDVMCQEHDRSGEPAHPDYEQFRCTVTRFDCGANDYFNPAPRAGSYLATHWNLASPLNRFVHGCTYATGILDVPTAGLDADEVARGAGVTPPEPIARAFTIPARCRGRRFAATGAIVPPSAVWTQVSPTDNVCTINWYCEPSIYRQIASRLPDVDICFYRANGSSLGCSSRGLWETGTVPASAARARVLLRAGARTTFVFSAV